MSATLRPMRAPVGTAARWSATPPIRSQRHASPLGRWEFARRDPPPELRPFVRGYTGWDETVPGPMRRREVPRASVPLIVSFGPPFVLRDPSDAARGPQRLTSFVAGLHDRATHVEHAGESSGVQIDLTPLGARRVLGFPLREIANETVALEDALGAPAAAELAERLALAADWAERFALLDGLLDARLADAAEPAPLAWWAWRRLAETGGRLPVGGLAHELRCSRRHLVAHVHAELGLPPKTLARLVRFERAVALMTGDDDARLAAVAAACGYYDQAHLNRDFRAFAGEPPRAFLARRLPDSGGVAA